MSDKFKDNPKIYNIRKIMLNINDYTYSLPPEKIALYPLPNRDDAKLLVYEKGKISHSHFSNIADFIPENSLLFFNNTRVIPARLHFTKDTGARIEILLLHPVDPSPVFAETMQTTGHCIWKCTIGNLKRWPKGMKLVRDMDDFRLEATLISKEENLVQFNWTGTRKPFSEVVDIAGETPLPPYLNRETTENDRAWYQTIYSQHEGAVAAPTAGLHFTDKVFASLKGKNIEFDFLTLHVSAGTFQPVKTKDVTEHVMHHEQVIITRKNITNLLRDNRKIIPVGTTSMRTLESLYWFGVRLLDNPESAFAIEQEDPYRLSGKNIPPRQALEAVLGYVDTKGLESLTGNTAIFIRPGYTFRLCHALITNFHQPASTLILLVAAFIGEDWRKVYDEALNSQYRFLSYGDASLLIP